MSLTLDELLVILRVSEKIKDSIYHDMHGLRNYRNDLVHDPEKIKELDTTPDLAKKLLQKGIKCIEKIRKVNF